MFSITNIVVNFQPKIWYKVLNYWRIHDKRKNIDIAQLIRFFLI